MKESLKSSSMALNVSLLIISPMSAGVTLFMVISLVWVWLLAALPLLWARSACFLRQSLV